MTILKLTIVFVVFLVSTTVSVNAQMLPCFDLNTPIAQAECLLWSRQGFIELPPTFEDLLRPPLKIEDSFNEELAKYFKWHKINAPQIGGNLDSPLTAKYFVIHNVAIRSSSTLPKKPVDLRSVLHHEVLEDGGYVNLNAIRQYAPFHVYIDWDGDPLTVANYDDFSSATYFIQPRVGRPIEGRDFIHVGLVLPSVSSPGLISFTETQAKTLALVYIAASIRAKRWLVPAFHSSLEADFVDYQIDPNFLLLWDRNIRSWVNYLLRASEETARARKNEDELERKLKEYESHFRGFISQLTLIRKTLPSGKIVGGYSANKVRQGFVLNKAEILEGLNNEEFAGMRAYVNRYYPSPKSLPDFQVDAKSDLFPFTPKYMPVKHQPLVTQESIILTTVANEGIKTVLSMFSTLRRNKAAIDFEVISDPSGATVTLKADGGKSRTADTNSRITNIFRGIYTYTVTKEGYKTINREIDLLNERGSTLQCWLPGDGSCVVR